jgi:nucleolar GTP-binding protein
MSFDNIPKIESADFYIDVAFRSATRKSTGIRSSYIKGSRIDKSRKIELVKLDSVKKSLKNALDNIVASFPSVDQMDEFYVELMKSYFVVSDLKKALSSVNWGSKKVVSLYRDYADAIKRCENPTDVNKIRNAFYGRISSLMKRLKPHLEFLESARMSMRSFPAVKTKMFSAVIFGFPNVGKTTLLSKLTGSKPEISAYAFTTKRINIGYASVNDEKIQFIDVPGALNRFEKMNNIEKQAYLVLKYVAHLVVYVFDLTEPYPLNDQLKLFDKLKQDVDKPIIVYLSKSDILDKDVIKHFREKYDISFVSDIEELKELIGKKTY